MEITPIGFIESCYKTKFGTPRQPHVVPASTAILRLTPQPHLQGALDGLEDFSHVWLVFQFHLNTNKAVRAKVHPPRLRGRKVGVFASRSPHRPNALGLSLVRVEKVEPSALHLSGIDLVDGTPIFDIKPYVPEADYVPEAKAGWLDQAEKVELPVEFSEMAQQGVEKALTEHPGIKDLIIQTLKWDPRPLVYREDNESNPSYEDTHAVYLENYDVHFTVKNSAVQVLQVMPVAAKPRKG